MYVKMAFNVKDRLVMVSNNWYLKIRSVNVGSINSILLVACVYMIFRDFENQATFFTTRKPTADVYWPVIDSEWWRWQFLSVIKNGSYYMWIPVDSYMQYSANFKAYFPFFTESFSLHRVFWFRVHIIYIFNIIHKS